MNQLWKVRIASVGWSLAALFLPAIFAVIESDKFNAFIDTNLSNKLIAGLVVVALPEIVKHFRNRYKLGRQLGAVEEERDFLI